LVRAVLGRQLLHLQPGAGREAAFQDFGANPPVHGRRLRLRRGMAVGVGGRRVH
jgi:hypothetical protein